MKKIIIGIALTTTFVGIANAQHVIVNGERIPKERQLSPRHVYRDEGYDKEAREAMHKLQAANSNPQKTKKEDRGFIRRSVYETKKFKSQD